MTEPLIISASGIRGIVDRSMTPDIAVRYGAAFGAFLREVSGGEPNPGRVLVGRDTRISGEVLAAAAGAGLRAAGWDVRDMGIAPTPTLLLAVREDERAAGCLIVTASHNPIEWNGFKLGTASGRFLEPGCGLRVRELFDEVRAPAGDGVSAERAGDREGVRRGARAIERHVQRILDLAVVDAAAIASARPLVALDCVRGVGGLILPRLLDELGCRHVGIDLEPDGRFTREPEPVPANLGGLSDLVRESGADLGMAIDPDGDRLALVDGAGRPVGEDWTLALAAEYVLSRRKGPVVTNLSSSQCIEDAAERGGAPFFRTPVGEVRVTRRMLEVDAVIGGEGNGGVILPDLNLTRDATLAAALVLGLLASRDRGLEELLGGWPSYRLVKSRASRPAEPLEVVYRRLESGLAEGAVVDREDGLRLSWRSAREWVHVRPSGTEPILRIYAESRERERAHHIAARAEAIISDAS